MRVAVDVCIGARGIRGLLRAGHEVVTIAHPGEVDRTWFARAMANGAEVVISADSDLEILTYDAGVRLFRPRRGDPDKRTVSRFVRKHGGRP